MPEVTNGTPASVTTAVESLRAAVSDLEAQEKQLAEQLANVKGQTKAARKALETFTGERPTRRRRRRATADAAA
jgi:uncharacterized protein YoxC